MHTSSTVSNNHPLQEIDRLKKQGMGVRVLDLSRVLAGPYCSSLLADMGADVIKLEMPDTGDDSRQFPPFKEGQSLYYVNLNRYYSFISCQCANFISNLLP